VFRVKAKKATDCSVKVPLRIQSLPKVILEEGRVAALSTRGGLWAACVAEARWANVAWRSFMNMAKLNWLS